MRASAKSTTRRRLTNLWNHAAASFLSPVVVPPIFGVRRLLWLDISLSQTFYVISIIVQTALARLLYSTAVSYYYK